MICKHLYRLTVYVTRSPGVPRFICSCERRAVAGALLLICHVWVTFIDFRNCTVIKTATFLLYMDGEKERKKNPTHKPLYPVENFTWESGKSVKEIYKYRCSSISKSRNMNMCWQTVCSFKLLEKKEKSQLVFTEQNLGMLFMLSEL